MQGDCLAEVPRAEASPHSRTQCLTLLWAMLSPTHYDGAAKNFKTSGLRKTTPTAIAIANEMTLPTSDNMLPVNTSGFVVSRCQPNANLSATDGVTHRTYAAPIKSSSCPPRNHMPRKLAQWHRSGAPMSDAGAVLVIFSMLAIGLTAIRPRRNERALS